MNKQLKSDIIFSKKTNLDQRISYHKEIKTSIQEELETTQKEIYPKKFYLPAKYEEEYVKNQLITYIGNKRTLIPLIYSAIKKVIEVGTIPIGENPIFVDYFSGSGVVSRMAKSLGFQIFANDWETYSSIINKAFIENSEDDLNIFDDEGGIDCVIDQLNELTQYNEKNAYISKYYCPQDDNCPNVEEERMFYTRENGIIIDNIRAEIESRYSLSQLKNFQDQEEKATLKNKKTILLSLLLQEASVRANTNGVFKAFHCGFGGKKGDALSRICQRIILKKPTFSRQKQTAWVFQTDALEISTKINNKADIVYLDPPYNQHQYGSNYHLLNTIARNDKPLVNQSFIINGKKIDKSAIRKDWIKTKSTFCSQLTAKSSFIELLNSINSNYILLSYSNDGIVSTDDIIDILSQKGYIDIMVSDYIRYRGGRQSTVNQNNNIEFVWIVDTNRLSSRENKEYVKKVIKKISLLMLTRHNIFPFDQDKEDFEIVIQKNQLYIQWKKHDILLPLNEKLVLDGNWFNHLVQLNKDKQQSIFSDLFNLFQCDKKTEIDSILTILENYFDDKVNLDDRSILKKLVSVYNKINENKQTQYFLETTNRILNLDQSKNILGKYHLIQNKFNLIRKAKLKSLLNSVPSHNRAVA